VAYLRQLANPEEVKEAA